jgi:hypothetical protein
LVKGHLEVTPNGISSDPRVATVKINEGRIEDLILIRLLTIAKSKLSRLLLSEVFSLPLESILSTISRYEEDLSDSVMSFISSSLGIYQVDIIVKLKYPFSVELTVMVGEFVFL